MKEQIENIAKVIHDSDIADINTFPISMSECLGKHGARRTGAAIALVNAGYRKQTELVREIFTEIDKIIDKHHSECNEYEDGDECDTAITYISYISCDIDDLYQKYMEGAENDR